MKQKLFRTANFFGRGIGHLALTFVSQLFVLALPLMLVAFPSLGMAQSCVFTPAPLPGKVYPLFQWRLANGGRLPQTFTYPMEEDTITMTIEDGASRGIGPNAMMIVLTSAPSITWRKEIAAWHSRLGQTTVIATQDGNHGPISMILTPKNCFGGAETIIFRKAKFLGVMSDMYHLDITNFWRVLAGKVVTFNWTVDDVNILPPYPMPCTVPCVPVGSIIGTTDIALVGPSVWNTAPVASSRGDGSFQVTNRFIGSFAGWASHPLATKLSGDFNGDGRKDIALTGPAEWNMLPVAFSKGNGEFTVTDRQVVDFPGMASDPHSVKLTGDFNGDGKTDIALAGPSWWTSLPVAFSNGDGTFTVTNQQVGNFAGWASDPQAVKLTGDFNGDGRTDIALTGPSQWTSLPVAFSNGDGTFTVTNEQVGVFANWSSDPQSVKLTGDFN